MTPEREHVQFDVLNDYVEGRLDPPRRDAVLAHLNSCDHCLREHDRLVDLLDFVAAVPDSVSPPAGLWEDVRSAIDRRKDLVLPVAESAVQGRRSRGGWWTKPARLVAAAVVLVVASSGITTAVLRQSTGDSGTSEKSQDGPSVGAPMLPASFRQTEGEYLATIAELRTVLQAQRGALRPETIAAVERSLSIIDAAIDEARTALLNDPGNRTLLELLTASYERKLDLLRRAADLGART